MMFEFVLIVALVNAVMLACMYALRHVIAIRAPVLFIAVGISVFYCILYPYLVSRVPYPKVLSLYALLIAFGAAVLYFIEIRFFSTDEIGDNEADGISVGDALAVADGSMFSLNGLWGMLSSFSVLAPQPGHPPDYSVASVKFEETGQPEKAAAADVTSDIIIVASSDFEPEEPAGQIQPADALNIEQYISDGAESNLTEDTVFIKGYYEVDTPALRAGQVVATVLPEEYCAEDKDAVQEHLEGFVTNEPLVEVETQSDAVTLQEPDSLEISQDIITVLNADEVAAAGEDVITSAGADAEGNMMLQERPEEADQALGDVEEQPLAAFGKDHLGVEASYVDVAAEKTDPGSMPDVTAPGGREPEEAPNESQISMMVAGAFDKLVSGDSAGAVEIFFRVLKMGPTPKLAVMLCIEISSIYLAEGHKRQALAVLEMLEVVWGHALDPGDCEEVKNKIKRLRGEIQ